MNRSKSILVLLAFFFCLQSFSQIADTAFALYSENAHSEKSLSFLNPPESLNSVKNIASKPAQFRADAQYASMSAYISEHLEFPDEARVLGITGEVKVVFDITAKGEIENIEVLESPLDVFSDQLIAVLLSMPWWSPAYKNGRAVKSRQQLNVNFRMP